MLRAIFGAALAVLTTGVLCAQTPAPTPSFEVASIKPAEPQVMGRMMVGMRGGPGSGDPGQVTYNNISLRMLLMNAYGVKNFQITGPAWLDTERFDIVAKVPKGASKDDVKPMLQNLLAERFALTLHHESKDMQMYALVVGKHGSKLKESVEQPVAADEPATESRGRSEGAPPPPPPPPPDGAGGPGPGGPPMGGRPPDFPKLPAGRPGMYMMMSPRGVRLVATMEPISALADMLGNQLQHPVTDMTGLRGKYDFTVDFAPDESMRMSGPMGPMPMPPPGGGGGGGTGGSAGTSGTSGTVTAPDPPSGPSLFTAIDEQLGLKLEPRKGPVDILIIDHIEKAPTEN
jgi:uncharacterized protein (TIGR03435 family)